MAIDLEALRLDIPDEDLTRVEGGSRFWKVLSAALLLSLAAMAWLHFAVAPKGAGPQGVSIKAHAVAHAGPQTAGSFTAGGWVEPSWPYPARISALTTGRLDKLLITEGMDIKSGDTVAVLNKRQAGEGLDAAQARLEVAQARLGVVKARADLAEAGTRSELLEVARATRGRAQARLARMLAGYREEEIARARALLEEAQTQEDTLRLTAERLEGQRGQGSVTQQELDLARGAWRAARHRSQAALEEWKRLQAGNRDVEVAEARAELLEAEQQLKLLEAGTRKESLAEARAELAAAEAEVKALQAEVDIAQTRLDYCVVKSPMGGRVLEIVAPQGSMLEEGHMVIALLYDPGQMQVRVDVRQEQSSGLRKGQRCSVKIEARKGRPYKGEVLRLDPQANLARDTVRAKILIRDPDDLLRKDMTATVDFTEATEDYDPQAMPLVVPRAAVVKRDGRDCVFLIRSGQVKLVPVELGEAVEAMVVVKSGLAAGDLVAVSNVAQLEEGTAVVVETGSE